MTDPVELTVTGHVAALVFAHPPNNHVNTDLLRSLADHLVALDEDPEVRCVTLASKGRVFCAGADLASADGVGSSAVAGADPVRLFYDQAIRLFGTRKPIVAAVQGAAIGAGLGLAMVADFRVASTEAKFAANFVRLGFHPGFGLTHTLPRCIGQQAAALMFLSGRRLRADEALGIGLVDQMAEPEALAAATRALADSIVENAPLALLATRQTLRAGLQAAVETALLREHAEQTALKLTSDYAEGVSSVFERRPGSFQGR
jgi:enoyl-CoA hydratase/carnithine racemase